MRETFLILELQNTFISISFRSCTCTCTNIRKAFVQRKTIFDHLMKREKVEFTDNEGKPLNRNFVYTSDLGAMLDMVCENRKIELKTTENTLGIETTK